MSQNAHFRRIVVQTDLLHNILVDIKDKGIIRFWFYKDEKMTELELFNFIAHIFGSSASPTVTSFVLIEHAHRVRDVISVKAFEIISRFFYVDDGTSGSDKWEECKELCSELKRAMRLGGFTLAKWKFSH